MSYTYTQRRHALGHCTPTLHILTCHHPRHTTLPTPCGTTCLFPQFSRKRARPFRCRLCIQQLDEEYLLAQLAENEELWRQYATHGWEKSAEELEEMEDGIYEKEGLLHSSVHWRVWRRYLVLGREGLEEVVRRRRREEEEEEMYVPRSADARGVASYDPNFVEDDQYSQSTAVPLDRAGDPFAIFRQAVGAAFHTPPNHNTPVAGSPTTGEEFRTTVDGDESPPLTDEEMRGIVAGNGGGGALLDDYWDGEYGAEYAVEEHWEIESV